MVALPEFLGRSLTATTCVQWGRIVAGTCSALSRQNSLNGVRIAADHGQLGLEHGTVEEDAGAVALPLGPGGPVAVH